jgi:type III secretion protein T
MNEIIVPFQQIIITLALCTTRFLAAFMITPFFNPQLITGVTRNCIAVSFALILFPTIFPSVGNHTMSIAAFFGIIIKEAVIGTAFGFIIGFFFWAVEAVGSLVDRQRGAAMAATFDPATGSETTPMGHFMLQLAIVLFFSTGAFRLFLSTFYESYRVWPILSYLPKPDADFARFFLEKTDDFMQMALLLSAPMLITMFLSELGLGLINRFAPQLNVFFLSMPIKSALAILVLIVYMEFFISYMKELLAEYTDVLGILKFVIQ